MNIDWNAVIWTVVVLAIVLVSAVILIWAIVVGVFVKMWRSVDDEFRTVHRRRR